MSIPEEDVNGTVTYDPESDLVIINRYGVEYTIPSECLTDNSNGSPYKLDGFIASGITGSVWALEGDNGKWIIRVTPLEKAVPGPDCDILTTPEDECPLVSTEEFENEASIATRLGSAGIAPEVKDYWICDNPLAQNAIQGSVKLGFIVMERYDMSLENFIKRYPRDYIQQYDDIIDQLDLILRRMIDDFHIKHLDLHPGNIVVRVDPKGRITEVRVIDFNLVEVGTPGDYENIDAINSWLTSELTERMQS